MSQNATTPGDMRRDVEKVAMLLVAMPKKERVASLRGLKRDARVFYGLVMTKLASIRGQAHGN